MLQRKSINLIFHSDCPERDVLNDGIMDIHNFSHAKIVKPVAAIAPYNYTLSLVARKDEEQIVARRIYDLHKSERLERKHVRCAEWISLSISSDCAAFGLKSVCFGLLISVSGAFTIGKIFA